MSSLKKDLSYRRNGFFLAAACGLIGVTYGVFADTSGLSLLQASTLSLLTFTGASQFAVVSVIDGGGNPAAAVGSALLLSVRNAFYGPVVASSVDRGLIRKAIAAHFVIDETVAMSSIQKNRSDSKKAFWFTGVWLFIFWNAGTVAGVLLGGFLEDPGAWGLDAAFPAAFVVLILPHVGNRPGQVTALIGGTISLICIPLTPVGLPILLAALAIGPGLLVSSGKESR